MQAQAVSSAPMTVSFLEYAENLEPADDIFYQHPFAGQDVVACALRLGEAFDDGLSNEAVATEPPTATARKAKVNRRRAITTATDGDKIATRHAETLRLLPPYDLHAAERNFHALIKANHPDTDDSSAASETHARELNEAIEYFRSAF